MIVSTPIALPPTAVAHTPADVVYAALTDAGFVNNADLQGKYEAKAERDNLSHNGDYVVLGTWTKGVVTLLFEQNTATEDIGGLSAAITHPAVCVISSPTGRVACNATDVDLILAVADEI
jgi:hypothetical protein